MLSGSHGLYTIAELHDGRNGTCHCGGGVLDALIQRSYSPFREMTKGESVERVKGKAGAISAMRNKERGDRLTTLSGVYHVSGGYRALQRAT